MKKFNITFAASSLIVVVILSSIAIAVLNAHAAPSPSPDTSPSASPTASLAASPSPSPSPTASPNSASEIRVIDVYRLGHEDKKDPERDNAAIGDIIVVKVKNLQKLIDQSKCIDDKWQKVQGCQEQEIALFLEGRKIKGIIPESGAPQAEEQKLQFHLQRNTDSDEAWADLLGAPYIGQNFFWRPTAISVGLENGFALPTDVKGEKFKLVRVHFIRFWICLVGLLILLYFILRLAKSSDILRDFGKLPEGASTLKTYSLARCQMAFWFFWVIASFLFIWVITGAYDTITATVLALIGIGAGTALGAAVIDAGKQEEASSQSSSLEAERRTLKEALAALDTQIAATPLPAKLSELQTAKEAKQTRLNLVEKQIEELPAVASPHETQGFLKDILNDAHGVSFHRFQMFVWTIVLGFLFVYSVWKRLSMPELGATLLALQGISAGTYLGFKIPEK